ncbi:MAG: outer membrane beta-barrel protein [Chitinophagales bacterium]
MKDTQISKQVSGSGNRTGEKQNEKRKDPAGETGFYAGIMAGPQFSQTKQQGFGGPGLSDGLLVGFHLRRKMAIETGFIISNKRYVSAGAYFDMSKISASMPSGMKLSQVQSKVTVFEIPVKFRYDVLKINQGNVFTTGGVSSYIITRESNQYHILNNGYPETLSGNYSAHQNYFAAAINVSAGYEWKVGKSLNFRVEPYLQIPTKTIGMGSMHVVSAGLYLGITWAFIK